MRKLLALMVLTLILIAASVATTAQDDTFALTVMHTNDTHSWHLPDANGNGGVALQAAVVKQIRAQVANTLLVDGGDRFTGTLFHTTFKGQDQVQIMNMLGYQAMTVGNHEFDNGDEVLSNFLGGLNFPVVDTNLDVSGEPLLADKIQKTAVLEVGGEKIGIIGLVTAETTILSSPGENVKFDDDYVNVINTAAADLTAQGVNKIVVLTHTGYNVDQEVIPQLENVDIYIGGHSHTLFSNRYTGAADKYPVMFDSKTGPVYYGQAGEKTQYLGRMDVVFDKDGVITSATGDTIFLSGYITPDADAAQLVSTLDEQVKALRDESIGATTDLQLVGERNVCRVEECLMGDLIADAMRSETNSQIAIMNGGGVRASIEPGDITLGEVLTVQPFGNLMSTFNLSGADVIAALENGVSQLVVTDGVVSRDDLAGRFPQVSGIRYTFDPTQEAGKRIVAVDVQAEDGTFSPIDPVAIYSVVTNNFMRSGGDGYTVLKDNAIAAYDFGRVDYDVTRDHLAKLGSITAENTKLEGRITMVGAELAPLE